MPDAALLADDGTPDMPRAFWSPSRGFIVPINNADGTATLWYVTGRYPMQTLPADAIELAPADELKRAERRAGHCNGRVLNPPCGYCEAVRQCERCELIAATMPKGAAARAPVA